MKVIDARELEPPEPFERVVDALSTLGRDEQVLLILNREPILLYRFLEQNDYEYKSTAHPDGRVEILIWEKSRG